MSLTSNNQVETIEIPVSYKNIFLKIVKNFSPSEVEERVFIGQENNIISKKIKEINDKEKKGEIKFNSFEEGEKKSKVFLDNLFSN